jgi:hypothetical protein
MSASADTCGHCGTMVHGRNTCPNCGATKVRGMAAHPGSIWINLLIIFACLALAAVLGGYYGAWGFTLPLVAMVAALIYRYVAGPISWFKDPGTGLK